MLRISATYETKRASWYESMGIMVVWEAWDDRDRPGPVHRVQRPHRPAGATSPTATWPRTTTTAAPHSLASNPRSSASCTSRDRPDRRLHVHAGRLHRRPARPLRPDRPRGPVADVRQRRRQPAVTRAPRPGPERGVHAVDLPQRHRPARTRAVWTPGSPTRWPTAPAASTRLSSASGTPASGKLELEHADEPQARDLHVLLPDPPVHARRVPDRRLAARDTSRPAAGAARRSLASRNGPSVTAGTSSVLLGGVGLQAALPEPLHRCPERHLHDAGVAADLDRARDRGPV